jgi:hypothetical protein
MKEKAFETKVDKVYNQDGFQMTFANGFTVSVVFGKYTYSDEGETTAEVAIWDKDGFWYVLNDEDNHMSLIKLETGTDVMGRCTADLVASIMNLARKEGI